jgi:hypothetical protein
MSIRTNNTCLNCENLINNLICSKHQIEVDILNVCDSHSYKEVFSKESNCTNCNSFHLASCSHPKSASEGMLCFDWQPSLS